MRQGRSSTKHEIKGKEIEKLSNKLKEEPHLSGAYIRSLVKQLTSSKSKDSKMNPKDPTTDSCVVDGAFPTQNLTKLVEAGLDDTKAQTHESQKKQAPPSQQQQQHKKQVRRRLHTSRPYQERLLNMAEARREIVTALKFHRAAMKQANEQQNQSQAPPSQLESQSQDSQDSQSLAQPDPIHFEHQESGKIKPRRNNNHKASTTTNTSNLSNHVLDNKYNIPLNFPSHYYPQNPLLWPPTNPILTFGYVDHQNLNLPLPNQALGLNLNFHDFNNIDLKTPYQTTTTTTTTTTTNPSSFYSSTPSPSTSSSPATAGQAGAGLHAAMDDEEIAEIRTLGEQHQMEWDDTMSLVTSAYWFKFFKAEDHDDHHGLIALDQCYPFDNDDHQVMEFPPWLSGSESQHHFDDYYSSDDYFHSPSLPCMEIGEIEAMDVDGDWLA